MQLLRLLIRMVCNTFNNTRRYVYTYINLYLFVKPCMCVRVCVLSIMELIKRGKETHTCVCPVKGVHCNIINNGNKSIGKNDICNDDK